MLIQIRVMNRNAYKGMFEKEVEARLYKTKFGPVAVVEASEEVYNVDRVKKPYSITEIRTGFRISPENFTTRKEAVEKFEHIISKNGKQKYELLVTHTIDMHSEINMEITRRINEKDDAHFIKMKNGLVQIILD